MSTVANEVPSIIDRFRGEHYFLSNFWPARVSWQGITYPTVEHAYQAAKTLLPSEQARIADCETPGKAKRLGRKIHVRSDWDEIKLKVMKDLLRQKFAHDELRAMLLETEHALLIEDNHWGDTYWGQSGGKGENWLGRLLMDVRDEIREELGP